MTDLIWTSATSLARAIRKKEVSAEEVVRAHLKRIEEVNPKLNAVVQLVADRALAEAQAADTALVSGDLRGQLHGVADHAERLNRHGGDRDHRGYNRSGFVCS